MYTMDPMTSLIEMGIVGLGDVLVSLEWMGE